MEKTTLMADIRNFSTSTSMVFQMGIRLKSYSSNRIDFANLWFQRKFIKKKQILRIKNCNLISFTRTLCNNFYSHLCQPLRVLIQDAYMRHCSTNDTISLIAKFMGPKKIWGPSGADRAQVGPMLAPWTLLSGMSWHLLIVHSATDKCVRTCDEIIFSLVELPVLYQYQKTNYLCWHMYFETELFHPIHHCRMSPFMVNIFAVLTNKCSQFST